jgi:hypothetical protein
LVYSGLLGKLRLRHAAGRFPELGYDTAEGFAMFHAVMVMHQGGGMNSMHSIGLDGYMF